MIIYRHNPEWELASEVPAIEMKAQISELKEKSELQFRITAVNQAGPSPTSDPTNIHIVKHKSCKYVNFLKSILILIVRLFLVKPIIDRTNLKNIVVKVGETVKYDVKIKGEPAPIVTWQLIDNEVCFIIMYFII